MNDELPELPPAPTGVAILRDGRPIPSEMVYDGFIDGCHTWRVTSAAFRLGDRLHIDVLPPHTSVVVSGPSV